LIEARLGRGGKELATLPEEMMDRAMDRGSTLRQMARFQGAVFTSDRLDALDEVLTQ
jgi:hypothetical protein